MITAVEIVKALTVKCRDLLQCDVNDRDISEGFTRPSFFIEVVDFNNEDIGEILRGDTLNIYIYYFNEKREIGYLNLLKARESLREMLAMPVSVADGFSITASDIVETINKADMSYITTDQKQMHLTWKNWLSTESCKSQRKNSYSTHYVWVLFLMGKGA